MLDTVRRDSGTPGPVAGPSVFAGYDLPTTLQAVTPLTPAAAVADGLRAARWTQDRLSAGAFCRRVRRPGPEHGRLSAGIAPAPRTAWTAVRPRFIGIQAPDLCPT